MYRGLIAVPRESGAFVCAAGMIRRPVEKLAMSNQTRIRGLVLACTIAVAAAGCASPYRFVPFAPRVTPALGEMDGGHALVRVFYATDRRDTGAAAPALRFGVERTSELKLGAGEVSIPSDHGRGRLESPGVLAPQDPSRFLLLTALSEPMNPDRTFWPRVRDAVALSRERAVFVFVHGYFSSFEDAARRTAQIAHDCHFDGVPLVYSWSSQQGFWGYLADRENVEWTERYLATFLEELVTNSGARRINLMAHSLGTQALVGAIRIFNSERPRGGGEPFAEIVLAASDMDAEIFARDYARDLVRSAQRVTIYGSSNDWALRGSERVNGYKRIGQLWPSRLEEDLRLYGRVEFVDATAVDKGPFGHFYYGASPRVLADLEGVFNDEPAKNRDLRSENNHWVFAAEPK